MAVRVATVEMAMPKKASRLKFSASLRRALVLLSS